MGHKEKDGLIKYSENTGKCTLHRIAVKNKGIDRTAQNQYWKNQISRYESVEIYLGESSEFHAENITLEGDYRFDVTCICILDSAGDERTDGRLRAFGFADDGPGYP